MEVKKDISEKDVTRAIIGGFMKDLEDYADMDVIIVGSGPAGLTAAKILADNNVRVLVIERNIYAGGGFWQGGYLFPKTVIEEPGQEFFEEMGVEFEEYKSGLYVADSFKIVGTLIGECAKAGVKFLNSTVVEDLIYKDETIHGVVIQWFPAKQMPDFITCMDPVALESKLVIDATGHDANLARRISDILGIEIKGNGAMDIHEAEKMVVENTKEIYPGLIISGMSVASTYGTPRMGPIFGGMILSGKKAAELVLERLDIRKPEITVEIKED